MPQLMDALIDGHHHVLTLPGAQEEVVPGVPWGQFDNLFTPAFWYSQVWYQNACEQTVNYRLGENLLEEIVACLLGGHGLPAEVGLAAFERIKCRSFLAGDRCTQEDICVALMEPLTVGSRSVRYRFPQQRSRFVAAAINRMVDEEPPIANDLALREWLLTFSGIGPKTASWITRNFLDSDNVAILDIHIYRAGLLAGIFQADQTVATHYEELEGRLIEFARALDTRLAVLDTLMWCHMREFGSVVLNALRNRGWTCV